jgi:hypothetical protein
MAAIVLEETGSRYNMVVPALGVGSDSALIARHCGNLAAK